MYPEGLLEETRRTLAIFFPRNDPQSQKWFERAVKAADGVLDKSASAQSLGSRGREIESYEFWHHRLSAVAAFFDSAEPRGFKAWWFDRRRGVQWINFWIAVTILLLTIFFGLVSSVTGILQVYFASRPQHERSKASLD